MALVGWGSSMLSGTVVGCGIGCDEVGAIGIEVGFVMIGLAVGAVVGLKTVGIIGIEVGPPAGGFVGNVATVGSEIIWVGVGTLIVPDLIVGVASPIVTPKIWVSGSYC